LEARTTDCNGVHRNIKTRLNSRNVWWYSISSFLLQCLISWYFFKKYKTLKLYKIILYLYVGLNLGLVTERRSQTGSVQEESTQ